MLLWHVLSTYYLRHHSGYRYNEGMRNYFEAGHCGPAHVVDVFNMTHALVRSRDLGRRCASEQLLRQAGHVHVQCVRKEA